MKEYGGYLEWEYYFGKEYHDGYRVDSVRSALAYTIKLRNYQKIYIPYYLCSCIKELLEALNVEYKYYYINKYFLPDIAEKVNENECVFLVNYFGQLSEEQILDLKNIHNVFLDNTQAFFNRKIDGIDMANSCRKFFGLPDGGYFYTDLPMDAYDKYDYDISYNKLECNLGRFELGSNIFYKEFIKNDSLSRGIPCKKMSKLVNNILKSIDYNSIVYKRLCNFEYLHKHLKDINLFHIKNNAGLFLYPLLIENGRDIKPQLIQQKVYVPTLWPEVVDLVDIDKIEYKLVKDLILLPIDQRYDVRDMDNILDRLFTLL